MFQGSKSSLVSVFDSVEFQHSIYNKNGSGFLKSNSTQLNLTQLILFIIQTKIYFS
jgi:hypothetical protein